MNRKHALVALVGALAVGCGGNGSHSGGGWSKLALLAGKLGGSTGAVDGVASAARFNFPQGLHGDGVGNVYIADGGNASIRKLVLATGAVTTLAGSNGSFGAADGTGSAARFNFPTDVAIDSAGNLYVADASNYCIRKIVPSTAVVTTLAGVCGSGGWQDGVGANALFQFPAGLALDAAGNLFVGDQNTLRQVVVATGAVTTIAGDVNNTGSVDGVGTAAQFMALWGLALDGQGNLFMVDQSAGAIRQMNFATGMVTTVAGNDPTVVLNGAQGIVADGAGNLYVADVNGNTVRKIVVATGAVTTLAGLTPAVGVAPQPGSNDGVGAAARFFEPSGLDLEGGNLIVSDALNNTVRKIVIASATTTTLAGLAGNYGSSDGKGDAARFNEPLGIGADGAGNVYVADGLNQTIRQISPAGVVTTLAGSPGFIGNGSDDGMGSLAHFNTPFGVVADDQGNLYVSDYSTGHIRKIVIASGVVTTIAGGGPYDQDGVGTQASFGSPTGLSLDGAGHLFVADSFADTIRQIDLATATVTTLAGTKYMKGSSDGVGAAALFDGPFGLVCDHAGSVYVLDSGNSTLRKIEIATGTVTTVAGSPMLSGRDDGVGSAARFDHPNAITMSSDGQLFYIADSSAGTIRKMVLATGAVTTVAGTFKAGKVKLGALPASFSQPYGVALLPNGDLVVSDVNENAVLVLK